MLSKATTVEEYLVTLKGERLEAMLKLRKILKKNLPKGFAEGVYYGVLNYVVPHKLYPNGYHCNPKQPLPFISIASQKNHIAIYHMGIYANPDLQKWFTTQYAKFFTAKLDMGKGCIRFKKMEEIPYDLLAMLFSKITPAQWIELYEKNLKKAKS
jgi:Domain of unknown function (DU1801)